MTTTHFLLKSGYIPFGIVVILLSIGVTFITIQCLNHFKILDYPNPRSSHQNPMPRGGGVGIFLLWSFCLMVLTYCVDLDHHFLTILWFSSLPLLLISFMDDVVGHVPAGVRLFVQCAVSLLFILWLGTNDIFYDGYHNWYMGRWWLVWSLLFMVWFINLYNFMDGIDGQATLEACVIALSAGFALWSQGQIALTVLLWVSAAIFFGFLFWNWPPAKIFLGDSGSGFFGFFFSALTIYTTNEHILPWPFWGCLMSLFVVDSTLTLWTRLAKGENIFSGHREHLFQILVRIGYEHRQVNFMFLAVNIFLAIPLAFLTLHVPEKSFLIACSWYVALMVAWMLLQVFLRKSKRFV